MREIHLLDGSDFRVLDELERLLELEEDQEGQLEILRKKAGVSNDREAQKELLFRIAELHRQTRAEEEMSRVYEEILELDSGDLQAIRALQGHHQLQGNHESVLDLLLRERRVVSIEEQGSLSQRIAHLETSLGRYREAIGEYSNILRENPEDEQARIALENIASEDSRWRVESMTVLEPIYRGTQNWEALVEALEARFETTEPRQRPATARELEEIYRLRLSDDEKAFHWSCQLLREDFDDPEVRERVELMADEMERWSDLLFVYEDLVRSFVDPQQITQTYLFIAQNYQERLQQPR